MVNYIILYFISIGGPEGNWNSGWSFRWNPQLYTNHGYVVIGIDPHGSTGYTSEFRNKVRHNWDKPYYDLMLGLEYIKEKFPYADTDKICAAGGSYGGYLVNFIAGQTNKFKCLISHDGDFDTVATHYGSDDLFFAQTENCPADHSPCNPYDSKEIRDGIDRYNPERFVANWTTPMLVIHGGNDYRVSLTNALSVFTACQLKGIESKLLYYPLENHWCVKPENSIKWYKEVLGWCDKYLKTEDFE